MTRFLAYIRRQNASRLHFLGSATLFLIIALFSLLTLPGWSRWTWQHDVVLNLQTATKRLNATRARIDSVRGAVASLISATDAEPNLRAVTLDKRVLLISDAASSRGMLIDSVEPKALAGSSAASITVNARGQYEPIVEWIHELRANAPDLQVQSLQLSAAANDLCSCRLTFNWSPPVSVRAAVAAVPEESR